MEYALIVVLTLYAVWGILNYSNNRKRKIRIVYSQSNVHAMIKPFIPKHLFEKPKTESQSTKHQDKNTVKVLIVDDEAYWVLNNVFYVAEADGGMVDPETTRPVDINNLNKKEIDKMLFILDSLNKGKNDDSSSTGDDRF